MSRHRKHRRHGQHRSTGCGPGFIRRVTGNIGKRFGLERRWVLFGFIAGLLFHAPLTILVFLVAWFWTDHPGKIEGWWASFKGMGPRPALAGPQIAPAPAPEPAEDPIDADPFFQDLKRKFDDLESRTGEMENHVASEEFELRREFKKMKE